MYFNLVPVIILVCFLSRVITLSIDVPLKQMDSPKNATEDTSIRCYCDLPACITGGYMCKSAGLGCFTELDNVEKARRACLDYLPKKQQACRNVPKSPDTQSDTLVLCCVSDLCNHPDTPNKVNESESNSGVGIRLNHPNPIEKLANGNVNPNGNSNIGTNYHSRPINYYSTNEVWFRAATIVVPIFGALILFALVVLAVKLLRSESLQNVPTVTKFKHNKHDGFSPNLNSNTSQIIHHFQDLTFTKKMPLLDSTQHQSIGGEATPKFSTTKSSESSNVNVFSNNILSSKNETYAKINNIDVSSGGVLEVLSINNNNINNNNSNNNNSINRLSGYSLFDIQKQTNPLLNYNLFLSDVNNLDESNSCLLQEPNCFNVPVSTADSNKVTYKKSIVSDWSDKL